MLEKSVILKNNLPIYFYPNQHLHSFCLCLYFKSGSMYESNELNGSTHFWEHILFRKLNNIYKGNFYKTLDKLGLTFSASTYKAFISIKVTGAKKYFCEAAKIIALVFEPINLTSDEIELEKKRIKAEKRESSEEYSLDYFTQKIVWENTTLSNTILGKNKVIDKIGIKALQVIHNQICSSGNSFFYVTGSFNSDDIAFLSQCVESYDLTEKEVHKNLAPVPENFFKRNGKIEVKNDSYHYIRFSFDINIPRYTCAELDLLYNILFSGDNSKIFMELSENTGYIYDFEAWLERYNNLGNLYFSFEIAKRNILPALQKTIEVLCNMKTNITDELACVMAPYIDNAEFDLDDAESLNWNMAYECHIRENSYKSIEEKKKGYQCVTPTRIMEIAKEIFTQDNMLITLKTDKKNFDFEEAYKITKKL